MHARLIKTVRESFDQIEDKARLATSLYEHLFEIAPETKSLFGEGLDAQTLRMADTIVAFVQYLDDPAALNPLFERLSGRHIAMGVESGHFESVGAALIAAVRDQLGVAWTKPVEHAWMEAYEALSGGLKRHMWMEREKTKVQGEAGSESYASSFLTPPPRGIEVPTPMGRGFDASTAVQLEFDGEQTVEASAAQTILQASLNGGIPHFHECGGSARCSTCRVEILEGHEYCSPRTPGELALARSRRFGKDIRLACQTRVKGDVKLRRLLFDNTDLSAVLRGVTQAPGRELPLAVLFLDLRGFTPFTERHLPYDVVHILNRFFNVIGEEIHANHGYIDKYMGDGLMALFGLNDQRIEHPCVDAVAASLGAYEALQRENLYFREHFGSELRFGIGIHYGPAIVGDVGYWRKQQLTALGDVVNGAARIEAATKDTNTAILVSDTVRHAIEEVAPDTCAFGASHDLELKGKRGVHRIHEVDVGDTP